MKAAKYFLGANSPMGFVSMFDGLFHPDGYEKMYVFKGGPGSGKSSFMKRLARDLYDREHKIELITCASDPESLDALIDYTARITIADGTAPHVIDTVYPGAYETILDAGSAWNTDILRAHRKEIVTVSEKISIAHKRCRAYVTAAGALLDYCRMQAAPKIDIAETEAMADAISMYWSDTARRGKTDFRLLSAVSVGEVHFNYETLGEMCDLIYEIDDEIGAVADKMISRLASEAVKKGYDIVMCPCSLKNPDKSEHLIIPELGIGITTANRFHRGSYPSSTVVKIKARDYYCESWRNAEFAEELDAAEMLIKKACSAVYEAKKDHDELEAWYIAAMDFTVMDELYERVINEITGADFTK